MGIETESERFISISNTGTANKKSKQLVGDGLIHKSLDKYGNSRYPSVAASKDMF